MKKYCLMTAFLIGCCLLLQNNSDSTQKNATYGSATALSVSAEVSDHEYTVTDLINLQNYLLTQEMPELNEQDSDLNADEAENALDPGNQDDDETENTFDFSGMDYDLNDDGVWNAVDLCLMKRELIKKDMPTRVLENGTKIVMHFGDTIIPGMLNDCDTAKALIEMLPYTVHMSNYSDDFCGVMPDRLPYNEDEIHYGWLNGDIDYSVIAPYFTILHSNEENSQSYSNRVNIGVITCELSRIRNLSGSYDVLIELAEEESD